MIQRSDIEGRILKILHYINHPIAPNLEKSLGLFSIKELSQIHEYLETGSLNPIYKFFEEKQKEYLDIISELKMNKRYQHLNSIRLKEKLELEQEKQEIEMISFDF